MRGSSMNGGPQGGNSGANGSAGPSSGSPDHLQPNSWLVLSGQIPDPTYR